MTMARPHLAQDCILSPKQLKFSTSNQLHPVSISSLSHALPKTFAK
jgi:hypothetical protein